MTGVDIRPAREDELDEVAALIVDAYAEYAARMSPDAWSSFAQLIGHVRGRAQEAETIVAEQDGRLVGAVTLFTGPRGVQEGTYGVRLLSVPPAERGKGIGRALMEYCVRRARENGRTRVILTTTQDMDVARELYESMGFEREPSLDHEAAPGVRFEGYALTLR